MEQFTLACNAIIHATTSFQTIFGATKYFPVVALIDIVQSKIEINEKVMSLGSGYMGTVYWKLSNSECVNILDFALW